MLPFLKNKDRKVAGTESTIVGPKSEMGGLEMAMADFCSAMESKDHRAMAAAMKAAFDILESEESEQEPE